MSHMYRVNLLLVIMISLASSSFAAGGGEIVKADPNKHFDPKGKLPSEFTIELQNGLRKSLPFEDKRDFEEAKKGFIAAPSVQADHGRSRACCLGYGQLRIPVD